MPKRSSEKTKLVALAVLGVILAGFVIYQIFFSSKTPKPKLNPQAGAAAPATASQPSSSAAAGQQTRKLSSAAQQEALMNQLLSDMTPLNLKLISSGEGKSDPGSRGNIFAYAPPPPPPPPIVAPPPPIQLMSISPQSAVAGTPRSITLVVSANKIPADPQILLDGNPKPTKRLSANQVSTELAAGEYSTPRNTIVQIRSQSNPAENSNSASFIVQAAPEPQFIYKGRLGTLNQPLYNYGVFELIATKEIKRAKVGETMMGVWRVDAIAADYVEVTLTQYDIKRRVPMQERVR